MTDVLLAISPADSARAVAAGYGVSLLLIVPLVLTGAALLLLRLSNQGAGAVGIVWRATIVAIAVITVARLGPVAWEAWVLPASLAAPFVALGRSEVTSGASSAPVPLTLMLIYMIGVAVLVARWGLTALRFRRRIDCRLEKPDVEWMCAWQVALQRMAFRPAPRASRLAPRAPRLAACDCISVPSVVGLLRPIVVLPTSIPRLTHEERVAVLVHELAHVAHHDLWISVLSRCLTIVHWYHPAVWIADTKFRASCERAADERVLAGGVRASTYVRLLGLRAWPQQSSALALSGSDGLRGRLNAIVSSTRVFVPHRGWHGAAAAIALTLAVPLGTMRVGPTRETLDALMQDRQWRSRAYAVVRLAQRADSVEVARAAARHDPDPAVRAWARYALAREALPPPSSRSTP